MFHDNERKTWRVQWTAEGKRHSRRFYAKAEAQLFEAEMANGMIINPGYSTETVAAFAERWLNDYCRLEKAGSQLINDASVIRGHVEPSELGRMRLTAVRKVHVLAFKRYMRDRVHARTKRPLSTKTVNNTIGLVRKMMATAVEWEVIPKSPAAGVTLYPQPEQAYAYWTGEERDRFVRFARQHDAEFAEIVMFACHTGLRRGEIAGLRRHQLDFDQRMILVNATYCFKTNKRVDYVKNMSVAWVPMDDAAFEILQDRRMLKPDASVFTAKNLLHSSRRLRELCTEVGSKSISFHSLRHTYASCLAIAGVNIFTVQKMMRHKSGAMTQRYAHLSADHLHEAARALNAPAAAPRDLKTSVSV